MSERFAIEARGVSKRYGQREALRRVDLVASPGRVHGLLGRNGAGKTTLMRVVLGLVRRDAGTVQLFGRDLDSAPRIPDGVAGMVDAPAFYPYLSGRRNLQLLARLDGEHGSAARARLAEILTSVGLATQADLAVSAYSAGMRQRLGLAAALLREPSLLLLDEPTSSLDPAGAGDVRDLLRQLADKGACVVLSSHDMSEVEQLCTSVTILDCGGVVFSGTIDRLRTLTADAVYDLRTSDDDKALELAAGRRDVRVARAAEGLEVCADAATLDRYVIALGDTGVAVRGLVRRTSSLETMFLQLTARRADESEPMA